MYRASCSGGKKGFLALEALIGTILSVVALVFLFQYFIGLIFSTPSNLSIVENNIENINQFIEMPIDNGMSSFNNCFFSLRLHHLENFQYPEEGSNYFYVIKSDGIYYAKLENLIKFQEDWIDKKSSNLITKELNFEDITLKIDKSVSRSVDIEAFFVDAGSYIFGDPSEFVELFSQDDIVYILKPDFGILDKTNNQNEYEVMVFEDDKFKTIVGKNLIFANSYGGEENVLFMEKTTYTQLLVKENLCNRKLLDNILLREKNIDLSSPDSFIDFSNKKVTFIIPDNGRNNEIIYDSGSITCSFSCSNIFSQQKNVIYRNFYDNLLNYFKLPGVGSTSSDLLSLNDYMKKIEESNQKSNVVDFLDFHLILDTNDIKTEFNFENFFGFNADINGCDTDECNLIYFQNGRLYFMIPEISSEDYFSFYEYFFRRVDTSEIKPSKVTLGNKVYYPREIELDGEGISLLDEDMDVYVIEDLSIIYENKEIIFDYYLTSKQLISISDSSEYGVITYE